ncbi:MAG: nitrite reductase [Flavobacteriales bacterium MED-G15]|nr:MAG: nitrite reductase [Flavobacteriales bacterium MED-G15]|tara:strand:+ start:11904 stop:13979 length:2076 start_codon:yes stop_codon:yes gene_type:complete
MKSFRTEIENPIVERDILDLEKKINAHNNDEIDEEKFRSLRLARGVYGQRQQGVQMIRIKLPLGRFTARQLIRMADVSDEYASSNLHITTRQDIQLHYVPLDRTPELWAMLEKDNITLREACGNTVRNVTASVYAGVDPHEAFDLTPYAHEYFEYFLRNPVCQEMGRKFKVAFSSSADDQALTFIHDLGFIPRIKNGKKGFRVLLGGGIGSQPMSANEVFDFLETDRIIPFSEAVIRIFDRHGERNRRNKARLKFLIKEIGLDKFLHLVAIEENGLDKKTHPIKGAERVIKVPQYQSIEPIKVDDPAYESWKKINLYPQKQDGYFAVGIPISVGDLSSTKAKQLAKIILDFTGDDSRFSYGQSILLRDVKEEHIPALYLALKKLQLDRIGFQRINDIVACPGTDTCNLGIASSMGLAKVLQEIIEKEYPELIQNHQIDIKISGCMNACGQHTLAQIGFQGMTVKSNGKIAPATQILLGGGVLGNGKGRFADKLLKVPSKRTPAVLRWVLDDFQNNREENEDFFDYYDRKTKDYFYQSLKHYSEVDNLTDDDFIDWGVKEKYEKAIGIGECAGVTIDLVQTLLFDASEAFQWAEEALDNNRYSDAIYHAYNARIRGAKAILTKSSAKINSHVSIIDAFDTTYPEYANEHPYSFKEDVMKMQNEKPTKSFAKEYVEHTQPLLSWIENHCHASV